MAIKLTAYDLTEEEEERIESGDVVLVPQYDNADEWHKHMHKNNDDEVDNE